MTSSPFLQRVIHPFELLLLLSTVLFSAVYAISLFVKLFVMDVFSSRFSQSVLTHKLKPLRKKCESLKIFPHYWCLRCRKFFLALYCFMRLQQFFQKFFPLISNGAASWKWLSLTNKKTDQTFFFFAFFLSILNLYIIWYFSFPVI